MNFLLASFAPLALLFPVTGHEEAGGVLPDRLMADWAQPIAAAAPSETRHYVIDPVDEMPFDTEPEGFSGSGWIFRITGEGFRPENARQVRVEQRVIIRIAPRTSPMRPPEMAMDRPPPEPGPHFAERKIGKCVPVSSISGVRANGSKELILFMRDRRIISAELERSCRARDFYSGFYLADNKDGKLCVDRDTLLSRSGSNCKLTRIRQLVENDR